VIGSISFAIITDLFKLEMRGRVMGFVQMAFAASQIFGIPVGLYLANHFGWHSPFWLIVGFSVIVWTIVLIYLKPITAHLQLKTDKNPVEHLLHTVANVDYLRAFLATVLLATGGFMLMPFGAAFSTFNMKISADELPFLYAVTGVFTMISGPILGRFADSIGKFRMFAMGTILSAIMVGIYTNLGATPLWIAIILNVIMFIGITGRMIPAQSLLTAVPKPQDRGAFMSINSSVQQFSGGIASFVAGLIVIREPNGHLDRYNILGFVVICSMLVAVALMYNLNRHIQKKLHAATPNI
ncbi:MAG: MFS transporter, partial [Sphingobacteriales bacterium]